MDKCNYKKINNIKLLSNDINTDIVLVYPSINCNEEMINKLKHVVYSKGNIGLAGYNNIKETKQDIYPNPYMVYIKQSLLNDIGGFDESITNIQCSVIDIAFRALDKGYISMEIPSPIKIPNTIQDGHRSMQYLRNKYHMRYFNITGNSVIVDCIKNDRNAHIKVLEIGCDLGATLLDIKNKFPNAEVYGTDIDILSLHFARKLGINVIECNMDTENLPYNDHDFDYIIFGDVLEHLRNPLSALEEVKEHCLKDDGKVIASIPNIMHISIIKDLILNGNFTYTDRGLLDKTHIHFFTEKEIKKMFIEAGYKINGIWSLETSESKENMELIKWLLTRAKEDVNRKVYTTFQYLCIASKNKY